MEQFEMDKYEELEGGLLLLSEGKYVVDLSSGGFSIVKDYPRIKDSRISWQTCMLVTYNSLLQ